MKLYYFYSKRDKTKEPIMKVRAFSRLEAAKQFSLVKKNEFKNIFINLYNKPIMGKSKNPILKQLEDFLGTSVDMSESPKTRAKKEQEIFCSAVDIWDNSWQRGEKLFVEHQIDLGGYDGFFYQIIEKMFVLSYGEMKAEIIAWWVYERYLEDGEIAIIIDENDKEYELKTSLELFKFIKQLK